MIQIKIRWSLSLACMCLLTAAFARENTGIPVQHKLAGSNKLESDPCAPASSSIDLNINNVRARLQNGGDMWWDLNNDAKYEVPKVDPASGETPVSSLFAGAIWVGGVDAQNQLKVAAATYRQNGNDFFPGPLDENAATDATTCHLWDKHFQVFGSEIDSFLELVAASGGSLPPSQVPTDLLNWPGYGNPWNTLAEPHDMAPFADVNGDGIYDPTVGDYPIIGVRCGGEIKNTYADQMIWWVYNDEGNIHTETGATAIGLEVQALAFAFKTNDEINDMTFYKYRLLNKAVLELDSTFMGQWVDPDLGCYLDDYIGCDIATGLGIVYNASATDCQNIANYGNQPPFEGVDYFQGPLDENGNELGMSSFLYYQNDFSVLGNPVTSSNYYGYLSGTWIDGTHFTEGGNAYGGQTPINFVFPDDPSDATGWSECADNVTPGDLRFIQSSGPFTLLPGANNDIIDGVVWVRPPIGTYPCPKFDLLKRADEKAQALFDNCFQILDGPRAPDVQIIELSNQVILGLLNTNTPETEYYEQKDPTIPNLPGLDTTFNFEGYQIYQVANSTVSTTEYTDPSKARLIAQCDVKNGISQIVNYIYDATIGADVPTLEVEGADAGISHSFSVTNDAFATGTDKRLVNLKTYYFSVIAYAYNTYSVADSITGIVTDFQKFSYLAGRKNIKIYSAIPHITQPEDGGLILNAAYGDGPQLTRIEGQGNGGLTLDLTDATVAEILANGRSLHPTYVGGSGPVDVKVYDPKNVPNADFELMISDTSAVPLTAGLLRENSTIWSLKNLNTGEVVYSEGNVNAANEQLIPDWGLSVYVKQVRNPGGDEVAQAANNNGFIDATIEYTDPQTLWLTGIPDDEGESPFNWIRSGTYRPEGGNSEYYDFYGPAGAFPIDGNQVYENLLGRTWAPYCLSSSIPVDESAPAWNEIVSHTVKNKLDSLMSFDLVLTPDKSKWTHCVVVEEDPDPALTVGGANKLDMRKSNSRNLDGSIDPNETGRSWFPGYAINDETGERLNIIFGEDSWLLSQNGDDMEWDPTSEVFSDVFQFLWGGRHWIYIQDTTYDEGQSNHDNLLTSTNVTAKKLVYQNIRWVSMAYLAPGYQLKSWADGIVPTETKIRIRVQKAYRTYNTDVNVNGNQPHYTFNTADIAAMHQDNATAVSALDTIKIIPNPYYAYSGYEKNQIENRVKIANLPVKCTISIYSLDGTLVRRYNRDDASSTYTDWDLKNDAGIPIASGVYIIHVNAEGIGEKTLKWFGVLRPLDLNAF